MEEDGKKKHIYVVQNFVTNSCHISSLYVERLALLLKPGLAATVVKILFKRFAKSAI